jgi:hypothetical protein
VRFYNMPLVLGVPVGEVLAVGFRLCRLSETTAPLAIYQLFL